MKKINCILLCLAACAGLSGCGDLMETAPSNEVDKSLILKDVNAVKVAMNGVYSTIYNRIDFVTAAGDVGDVSSDSWLKDLLAEGIPYAAEVITFVPYSKLESKRMNPVIEVRIHIDATKPEMKKRLGWDFIPEGVYGSGKRF